MLTLRTVRNPKKTRTQLAARHMLWGICRAKPAWMPPPNGWRSEAGRLPVSTSTAASSSRGRFISRRDGLPTRQMSALSSNSHDGSLDRVRAELRPPCLPISPPCAMSTGMKSPPSPKYPRAVISQTSTAERFQPSVVLSPNLCKLGSAHKRDVHQPGCPT